MSIEIHCQGCGKLIRAPRDAAGRWARCPACGREMYIPTPPEEIEELPLSPEDTALLEREATLQAERRRLDSVIRREKEAPNESSGRRAAPRETTAAGISESVIEYLRAMERSDLGIADRVLPLLQKHRTEALALLDRLAADQMPPAALSHIPPGVYQGFLKHLRSQL